MSDENKEEEMATPITTGDLGEESSEEILTNLRNSFMGGDSPEEEIEESEEEEESSEESEEEESEEEEESSEESEEEESEEEEESDEDELNLDEDPEEEEESEESEEEEEIDESKETAVTQLRKVFKQKKQLEAENNLLNEQLVNKDQEIKEVKDRLDKMSATRVDPTSHPDFISLRSKTHNGIATQLRRVVGTDVTKAIVGTDKEPRWGKILTDVATMNSLPFDQQDEVEDGLRLHIAQRLGFQGDELDSDIDSDYIEKADSVIRTVGNFTPQYDELADLHNTIVNKSQSKSLELGHKEYGQKTKNVREGLAIIETMSEKDIKEDPDSLQSMAAQKIARSPQLKAKFDLIKRSVLEMAYGPEALSQEELDTHAATGKDMDEFHKNREKRVETFRDDRLVEIASLLTLLPEIKKVLPEHFRELTGKEQTNSKKKILRRGKKLAPKKDKVKKSPEDKTVEEHKAGIQRALGMP